ncbi:MAG: flavodoxin-dependent (E)-4-hydroxy-3-methylbut-2-enyl-diphosphate synthase, partial [Bacteroidales bacterium]|nr:flavodoxin-dependent (E)-4-hydroxy-3-methylbut-2-enyl-diphosphate synthase [Bacteroidales bacterium]
IKKELKRAGFVTPLIADVHFNPAAAETAARIVEKVRINPGNYVDKRATFASVSLSDKEYKEELERIHARLLPLISILHRLGSGSATLPSNRFPFPSMSLTASPRVALSTLIRCFDSLSSRM